MSEKRRERGTVIRNSEISNGIFDMWVRTEEIARLAVPGQFVTLYCEDESRLLPRPISVCDTDETNRALRVVYRIAGKGTKEFAGLSEGAPLTLAGPFGNGFPIRKGTSFLIGGGIGIPPMLALAKRLGGEKQMILGFRDKTFLADEFLQYGPVFVATEDGSAGTKGNVLDAIREHHLDAERIYACGAAAADAAGRKSLRRRAWHGVLRVFGGTDGVRHRGVFRVRLQIEGDGCAYECAE